MQPVHCVLRSVARALCGATLAAALVAQSALTPASALAQAAPCELTLGFASLRSAMGTQSVGECLEQPWQDDKGHTQQRTTVGLFVWRPADSWTGFTDGFRTWINGPAGLAVRPNYE